MKKGFYIVFEGMVGTGKSTQSKKLAHFLERQFPQKEIVWTYEPGGSEVADAIRRVVQATSFREEMDPTAEAYLYAASRAQTLRKIVKPALERNAIVISDRSFITSLAFQGLGRGIGLDFTLEINKSAIQAAIPDLVILLKLPPEESLKRVLDIKGDKFESESLDFFRRVVKGYQKISRLPMFKGRWIDTNADGNISDVFYKVLKRIA